MRLGRSCRDGTVRLFQLGVAKSLGGGGERVLRDGADRDFLSQNGESWFFADRERLQAVMELAQAIVADAARSTDSDAQRAQLVETHAELVTLAAQAPNYNFDTGLLTLEIGTLLMRAAPASAPAHG